MPSAQWDEYLLCFKDQNLISRELHVCIEGGFDRIFARKQNYEHDLMPHSFLDITLRIEC